MKSGDPLVMDNHNNRRIMAAVRKEFLNSYVHRKLMVQNLHFVTTDSAKS